MKAVNKKLGEMLLEENKISQEQLEHALVSQKETGQRLGHTLIDLNYISEPDLLAVLTHQFGIPAIHIDHKNIDPLIIKMIPSHICKRYRLIPFLLNEKVLTVAATDPFNLNFIQEIKFTSAFNVELVLASEKSVMDAIEKIHGPITVADEKYTPMGEIPQQGMDKTALNIPEKIELIINKAMQSNAREIHLENRANLLTIIYLSDKTAAEQRPCYAEEFNHILLGFMGMAKMDLSKADSFQEGLFMKTYKNHDYFCRTYLFPTPLGKTLTIKIS
jgi:type IV pilus assembly protein PilB